MTGFYSDMINGDYEPGNEYRGGFPVYRKSGSDKIVLDYDENSRDWNFREVILKGSDRKRDFTLLVMYFYLRSFFFVFLNLSSLSLLISISLAFYSLFLCHLVSPPLSLYLHLSL